MRNAIRVPVGTITKGVKTIYPSLFIDIYVSRLLNLIASSLHTVVNSIRNINILKAWPKHVKREAIH